MAQGLLARRRNRPDRQKGHPPPPTDDPFVSPGRPQPEGASRSPSIGLPAESDQRSRRPRDSAPGRLLTKRLPRSAGRDLQPVARHLLRPQLAPQPARLLAELRRDRPPPPGRRRPRAAAAFGRRRGRDAGRAQALLGAPAGSPRRRRCRLARHRPRLPASRQRRVRPSRRHASRHRRRGARHRSLHAFRYQPRRRALRRRLRHTTVPGRQRRSSPAALSYALVPGTQPRRALRHGAQPQKVRSSLCGQGKSCCWSV
jgi:hypothetical protein